MGKWPADRLAASSGFVFLVLYIVAMFVVPKPPSLSSPNAKVAAYYIQHHRAGLVQAVLLGLSAIAFIWFVGSLAALIRNAGEVRLASVAFGGGIAMVGLAFLGTTIDAALFERVALQSPSMAGGLHVIAVTAFTVIGFAAATVAFATAIAVSRTRVLPSWYAILTTIGGVVFLFGGGALTFSGFYSPQGTYWWISTVVFLAWTLVTTAELVQHAQAGQEAPRAAMAQ
jgi:hypothetical protein